jgi:hypothetical protein
MISSVPEGCPLCGRTAQISSIADGLRIDCQACGSFYATDTFLRSTIDPDLKQKIGFWTRDQNELGDIPRVTSSIPELVKTLPEKSVQERADRLLKYGIRKQRYLGAHFSPLTDSLAGYTHSLNSQEVLALAEMLETQGWIKGNYANGVAKITPQGFMYASKGSAADSSIGFIAMWFEPSMDMARIQGLEPAIRAAGYEPIVVSGVEHINKIDDEIVSQIRRSKFLVADFTGHRGGVYFEAGLAMGLGLPVFWTCRQDDLSKLHFDVRQYNCIDWTDEAELAQRLQRRIEAVIGRGPIKKPDVG